MNTRKGHFSYYGTVRVNPFRGFGIFRRGNNNSPLENNNNNNLLPLPPPGFRKGLGGGFNPPPGGNTKGLDPNIAALVNTLTGTNLGINHTKRESNHIKLTEFRGTEIKDSNE